MMFKRAGNSKASKLNRISVLLLTLAMLLVSLCGCTDAKTEEGKLYIYDINREHTKLCPSEYVFKTDYSAESDYALNCVGELLDRMIVGPEEPDIVGAIGTQIGDVRYYIEGSVATIDFGSAYYNMEITGRVLRMAAIARTLCQIDGVTGVSFTVNHEMVCDSGGQPIGVVTPEMFLENDEAKINAYEKADLHLYYANADGTGLVEVVKPAVYISNISMERLVVDNLIKGPSVTDGSAIATINPETKILNVTVKDGICYVNLSSDFLTKTSNVSDEVLVYSIVNSLTSLSNENKVQLMIDGETEVSLGSIYLSTPFMSRYDLVER